MVQILTPVNSIKKFLRTYYIQIQGRDGSIYNIGDSSGKSPLLSFEFNINREIFGSSQSGTFKIKNLPPEIRNVIYRDYYNTCPPLPTIVVQAGYAGSPLSTIFNGIMLEGSSYRQEGGVDFITEIQAMDYTNFLAPQAYTTTTLNKALNSAGITQSQVINQLVNDLINKGKDNGLNPSIGLISPNYKQIYNCNTLTLDGWSYELLQTYTGKTSFMDNGRIYCLQNNETFDGDVSLISANTGLLGTPRKFENRLICDLIFEPSIIPGQQVYLDLTTLGLGSDNSNNSNLNTRNNGTYKIISLQHRGSISSSENAKCITTVGLLLTPDQINAGFGQNLPANAIFNGN